MYEVLQQIGALGLVPVVKIDNAADAVPLARALGQAACPWRRSHSARPRPRKPSGT